MDSPPKFSPVSIFKTDEPPPPSSASGDQAVEGNTSTLTGPPEPSRAVPPAPLATRDARPMHSASAGIARTLALILKLAVPGTILLAGAYFTMKSVVPVIKELAHPGGASALHDKNAPTFVKAIQKTRQVVAKSDANVAYLNSLVGVDAKTAPAPPLSAPTPTASAATPAPPPVALPEPTPRPVRITTYAPSAPAQVDTISPAGGPRKFDPSLRPFSDAVARLKIDGVVGGHSPRILIDGVLVKMGESADYSLKLRFTGVDPVRHVIFFTNEDHVVFQRHY